MSHRHRGLLRAGAWITGAGLLLSGGILFASCAPDPLPPPIEIEAVDVIDLEVRVFELEAREVATTDALDALKPLGERVAAVEARTRAVEARIDEVAAIETANREPAASLPKRRPAINPTRAPRGPSCPILAAAMTIVRP